MWLIALVCLLVGAALGAYGMRRHMLRPRPVVQEDRNAGLLRYQEMKRGG